MSNILLPGDYICEADGFIKGHGTSSDGDNLYSMYLGKTKQINKLMTVVPLFSFKYSPEVGDVVVGRITHIFNKKWKIDTNSRIDTTLSLSSINLPGVMQRRKSETDEMNMRNFFDVNDMVVCEVQKVSKNGSAALHTRNDKYGKLSDGVLITVPIFLIVPLKTRFLSGSNINVVVGCNGYIWIYTKSNEDSDFKNVCFVYKTIQELSNERQMIDVEKILNEL